jgi:hypothetical protein
LFIKSTPTYPTTLCHFVAHNSHKHFLNHTTFTYKNNNNNNKYVAQPSFPVQSNGGFKRFIFPYLKKEKKKKKKKRGKKKRRAIHRCEEMSVEK